MLPMCTPCSAASASFVSAAAGSGRPMAPGAGAVGAVLGPCAPACAASTEPGMPSVCCVRRQLCASSKPVNVRHGKESSNQEQQCHNVTRVV